MTIQIKDHLWYQQKEYTLIGVEKGKQIMDAPEFQLQSRICETNCWRGFFAEYQIRNRFLYGKRLTWKETTPELPVRYTGSLVIAVNDDGKLCSAEFWADFLYFDHALELEFSDGRLVWQNDLSEALAAWKENSQQPDAYVGESLERAAALAKQYLLYEYESYLYQI